MITDQKNDHDQQCADGTQNRQNDLIFKLMFSHEIRSTFRSFYDYEKNEKEAAAFICSFFLSLCISQKKSVSHLFLQVSSFVKTRNAVSCILTPSAHARWVTAVLPLPSSDP